MRDDQPKGASKRSSKAQGHVLQDGDTREDQGGPRSHDRGDRFVEYPQSLGRILQHVLEPLCQRKPHMRMMMDWPLIVGPELAQWTWPMKVHQARQGPGVLYVQVHAAHYFQAWSQTSLYVDRVNQYMGYGAVQRVHFTRVESMHSTSAPAEEPGRGDEHTSRR